MATLIISTHLDDAVLSSGQYIAEHDCTVMTVFAGVPTAPDLLTPYDKKMGFNSSAMAMRLRQNEDRRALQILGAQPLHLNFLDSQYGHRVNTSAICDKILQIARNFDEVMGPIGIQHPDHLQVNQALVEAAEVIATNVYLYADLPYASVFLDATNARIALLDTPGYSRSSADFRQAKLDACRQYTSQWDKHELTAENVMITERMWRIK